MSRITILTDEEASAGFRSQHDRPLFHVYYQHQMKARDLQRQMRSSAESMRNHAANCARDPENILSVRLAVSAANDLNAAHHAMEATKETLMQVGLMLDEMAICVPGFSRD